MNSKMRNRGVIVLALIFVVLVAGYFLPRPHFTGVAVCSIEDKLTVPAPDNTYQAVIYEAACKPTGTVSMHVSIYPAGERFLPDKFPAVFSVDGAEMPAVAWSGPREVKITPPKGKVTLVKTDAPGGIVVTVSDDAARAGPAGAPP